jgi:hypothetical protein
VYGAKHGALTDWAQHTKTSAVVTDNNFPHTFYRFSRVYDVWMRNGFIWLRIQIVVKIRVYEK